MAEEKKDFKEVKVKISGGGERAHGHALPKHALLWSEHFWTAYGSLYAVEGPILGSSSLAYWRAGQWKHTID